MGEYSYRDTYDALAHLVPRSEHGRCALYLQQVGLWPPALSPESARARMSACLNPDKAEYLKPQEVLALMAFTRRYDPLLYMCDRLGLSRPRVLDPGQLLTEAAERAVTTIEQARSTLEQCRHLMTLAEARIPPAIAPAARFSMPESDGVFGDVFSEVQPW